MRLKSLAVDRFRVLRSVRLEFPSRGVVLVEGPNESGKSSLFEAVFFALFGRGIKPGLPLGDLVAYEADSAEVRVQLASAELEVEIRRLLGRRCRPEADLTLTWAGGEPESVSGPGAVTARVSEVLGLDGEAFLNSCFCEQKRLDRLESLATSERERTVMVLLNLDRLRALERDLRPSTAERRRADELCERAKLAEARSEVGRLKADLERLRRRAGAVKALGIARRADELRRGLEEQRARLADVSSRLSAVQQSLGRAEELEQARAVAEQLGVVAASLVSLERELAEHDSAIRELEQIREAELPGRRRRVRLLDRLLFRLERVERLKAALVEQSAEARRLDEILRQAEELRAQVREREAALARAQDDAARASSELRAVEEMARGVQRRMRALQRLADRLSRIDRIHSLTENTAVLVAEAQRLTAEVDRARARAEAEQKKLAGINARRGALRALIKAEAVLSALEEWQSALELKRRIESLNAEAEDHSRKAEEASRLADESARRAGSALQCSLVCLVLTVAAGTAGACLYFTWPYWYAPASASGVLLVPLAVSARAALVCRRRAKQQSESWSAHAQSAVEAAKACEGLLDGYRARVLAEVGGELEPGVLEKAKLAELGVEPAEDSEKLERLIATARAAVESRRKAWDALNGSRVNGSPTEALRVLDVLAEMAAEECRCAAAAVEESERTARQARELVAGDRFEELERWCEKRDRLISEWTARAHAAAEALGVPLTPRPSGTADGIGEHLHAVRDALGSAADELEAALSAKAAKERAVSEAEAVVEGASAALKAARAALEDLRAEDAAERHRWVSQRVERLEEMVRRWADSAERSAVELGVEPAAPAVTSALAGAEMELQRCEQRLSAKPELERRSAGLRSSIAEIYSQAGPLVGRLEDAVGISGEGVESGAGLEEFVRTARSVIEAELAGIDTADLVETRLRLQAEADSLHSSISGLIREIERLEGEAAEVLSTAGFAVPPAITEQSLADALPEIAECRGASADEIEREREEKAARLASSEALAAELESRLGLAGEELDPVEEARRRDEALHSLEVRDAAAALARSARERTAAKALPATMANLRRILPLITCGRYHDAEIDEGYAIRIWDDRAGAWMVKDVFSGGAQELFSLALRLSFTLAAVPGDLRRRPSFLVLDEPFSSFDAGRVQAVLNLLTEGPVAEAFDQVFVITSSVPPVRFPFAYRVHLVDGQIAAAPAG